MTEKQKGADSLLLFLPIRRRPGDRDRHSINSSLFPSVASAFSRWLRVFTYEFKGQS